MKNKLLCLLAPVVLLAVLLSIPMAQATDHCVKQVQQIRVPVKEYVPEIQRVKVPVHYYTPTYYPPYYPPHQGQQAEQLRGREELLLRLLQLLLQQRNQPAPQAPLPNPGAGFKLNLAAPQLSQAEQIMGKHCSACHTQGSAKRGGGFELLAPNGRVLDLDCKQLSLVTIRTDLGEMPPKGRPPVSDQENQTIKLWAREQIEKLR